MNRLIGITGLAGSGKSTAAQALEDAGYWRMRFADPLKAMVRALLRECGYDDATIARMIDGDLKQQPIPELCGKTPRQVMQTLGTEWGRNMVGDTLWTGIARRKAERSPWPVVVDDVRFGNEAGLIRDMGGMVIKVRRPGVGLMDHPSETGVLGIEADVDLDNGGTEDALRRAALTVCGITEKAKA